MLQPLLHLSTGCQILLSLAEANAALTALGSARKRLLARRKGLGSSEAGLAEVVRHQEAQVRLQPSAGGGGRCEGAWSCWRACV
jgi:hypothetical protein